ncbi:MAG: type II toxin-antitoxin system VapC family toxin [Candidatus Solibacter sp.]
MLTSQLLLDTHIVFRWFAQPNKLSREQLRAIQAAEARQGPVGVSAYSLIEFVLLAEAQKLPRSALKEILEQCETNPLLQLLPFTAEIAAEMAAMGDYLRDPGDRVIVATARVHGMRLITADQRIIESHLVPVIE